MSVRLTQNAKLTLLTLTLAAACLAGCGGEEEPADVRGTGEPVQEVHVLEATIDGNTNVINTESGSGKVLKEWIEQNVLARRASAAGAPPAGEAAVLLTVTDPKSNVERIEVFPGYVVIGGNVLRLTAEQQATLTRLLNEVTAPQS